MSSIAPAGREAAPRGKPSALMITAAPGALGAAAASAPELVYPAGAAQTPPASASVDEGSAQPLRQPTRDIGHPGAKCSAQARRAVCRQAAPGASHDADRPPERPAPEAYQF